MTEQLRQSLSAAMDDEADAFELRRVLDELGRDDELRALWDRYHLIGNALRGEPARASGRLRDRIWEALETTPVAAPGVTEAPASEGSAAVAAGSATTAQPGSPARSRLGRYTGLAVAASVAFAVVLGFNGLGSRDAEVPAVAANDAGPGIVTPVVATTLDDTGPRSGGPAVERVVGSVTPRDVRRAQAYMLHHAQQQALNQAGVMSFVKLATYEAP
ncbi:MAG: sigma-E factor negative regulatory protein [Pseudomonadales bacterium]